jgi:hypothetical protein
MLTSGAAVSHASAASESESATKARLVKYCFRSDPVKELLYVGRYLCTTL